MNAVSGIGKQHYRVSKAGGLFAACAAILAVLGGCGGSANRPQIATSGEGARPLQFNRGGGGQTSALTQIDEAALRRAIDNYRINKKRADGPFRFAGADLNGDGTGEALVLFSGKDWCTNTGCSLAIFRRGQHGFQVISRTVRVKAPVVIAAQESNGWRDLYVSTGGAATAPLRRVRLRFSGSAYTRNAMLEEEIPPDVPQFGDTAIADSAAQPGQLAQGARASNP